MATEWISSLVTGAVGAIGIAGTYLSVRSQRKERLETLDRERAYQLQDTLRQERKQVYAAFLDAADTLQELYLQLGTFERGRQRRGESTEALDRQISELRDRTEALGPVLRSAVASLDLVAPENVRQYAGLFYGAVTDYQVWALFQRMGLPQSADESITDFTEVGRNASKMRMDVIEAMRWDLTETEDHLARRGHIAGRSGQMYPNFIRPDQRAEAPEPRADEEAEVPR